MVINWNFIFYICLIAFASQGNSQKLFDKDFEDRRPALPGKPDEIQCANEGFLAKIILWAWPNPKPVPPDTSIQLKLYSREYTNVKFADNGDILTLNGFYAEKETVLICHGFLGNSETSWMTRMAKAYVNYADVNVFLVDWGIYAQTKNYHDAAVHTKEAGKQVGALLHKLYTKIQGLSSTPRQFKPIHMIGFSLGSHVMGIAASTLRDTYRNSAWIVKRITGLDPAFPCFQSNENSLDDSDAEFVDIIHTNGDQHYGIKLGMVKPIGHVDFYVNGGQVQPGCAPIKIPWYLKYLNPIADTLISLPVNIAEAICSHQMAPEYFIESLDIARLNGKPLKGTLWDTELCSAAYFTHTEACSSNCMPMGIKATKSNDRGIYYVPVATKKPFNKISPEDRTAIEEELERTAYRQR